LVLPGASQSRNTAATPKGPTWYRYKVQQTPSQKASQSKIDWSTTIWDLAPTYVSLYSLWFISIYFSTPVSDPPFNY
jgi:hypothetical protein